MSCHVRRYEIHGASVGWDVRPAVAGSGNAASIHLQPVSWLGVRGWFRGLLQWLMENAHSYSENYLFASSIWILLFLFAFFGGVQFNCRSFIWMLARMTWLLRTGLCQFLFCFTSMRPSFHRLQRIGSVWKNVQETYETGMLDVEVPKVFKQPCQNYSFSWMLS